MCNKIQTKIQIHRKFFKKSVQCVLFKPLINKNGLLFPLMILDIAIIFFQRAIQKNTYDVLENRLSFIFIYYYYFYIFNRNLECSDQPSNNT